jgi:uncharacterized RDD family membrane protein YckC
VTEIVPPALMDTDVVWWRVAQYVVDTLVTWLGWSVGLLLFVAVPTTDDGAADSGSPAFWVVSALVALWSLYWPTYVWVLRPHRHDGQTWGMRAVGISVLSADGAPASIGQLIGRALLLVVDTLAGGLVGLVTMLISERHQRLGDMAARTVVCRVPSLPADSTVVATDGR